MQTTLVNTWMKPMRFFAAGTCAVLMAAFTLCPSAMAVGPTAPPVVVTQVTNWGEVPGGNGTSDGGDSAGTSLGVNQNGDVIIQTGYEGDLVLFNGTTGAQTTLSSALSNPGGIGVDPQGNIFVGHQYGNGVFKVPYVNGQYVAVTTDTPSTACTGTDSTECNVA
ncbi:MAG: hypothetical protein ACRD3S_10875, partial [Terracidiphilus sp.]